MNVFNHLNYRDFLRSAIAQHKSVRGYQAKMARAAGCQASHLSRVMNGDIQLTPDHAAGLCTFWGFDSDETTYFLDLVHLDRAATSRLQTMLRERLSELRDKRGELTTLLKKPLIPDLQDQLKYYSSWHYGAIHMLVMVPGHDSINAIVERLRIPHSVVEKILGDLQQMGLVETVGKVLRVTRTELHLPRSSPMTKTNHSNWRQKAMDSAALSAPLAVHYTALSALSKADAAVVKSLILDCIKKIREIVGPSPEETLMCFTCDFFEV